LDTPAFISGKAEQHVVNIKPLGFGICSIFSDTPRKVIRRTAKTAQDLLAHCRGACIVDIDVEQRASVRLAREVEDQEKRVQMLQWQAQRSGNPRDYRNLQQAQSLLREMKHRLHNKGFE
jgi:hypothetical protein